MIKLGADVVMPWRELTAVFLGYRHRRPQLMLRSRRGIVFLPARAGPFVPVGEEAAFAHLPRLGHGGHGVLVLHRFHQRVAGGGICAAKRLGRSFFKMSRC